MLGGQVRGWGALWGFYLWSKRGCLNSAPRPTHIVPLSLTFPGSCLPQSLRWNQSGPRRNHNHPLHTHSRARAHTHGHSSPPTLARPSPARIHPISGKVIRFKGPGLETGRGGGGRRGEMGTTEE